ncbi:hypothetical protein F2Q70_00034615 [Brassica cretica]|uniref:Uncharacterized protein n=1 Tax=Brassica cretica TaxID=69181 RepID=A0A8S9JQZ4_BRACR|nr:hypothetical protein F2Q70_00034615 [Brassica cretica]
METDIAGKDRSGSDPTVLELSDGVFGVSRERCASRGKGTAGLICNDITVSVPTLKRSDRPDCGRRSVLATYERRLTGIRIEFTGAIGSRELVCETGMAVRCTDGIEGCRAEYVLTGLGVINDCFWNASKAGVLSVLDGWLETKLSLFVHGHEGMVG